MCHARLCLIAGTYINTLSSESSLPDSALPGCKELVGKDCGYIGSAG